jgi:hypothetical protein
MTTTKCFALAISPVWRPALFVLGVTPKRSFIEIGEEDLHVCFGRLEYCFPLKAAEDVTLSRWPLWAGIGARTNFRGSVGLVGTYVNVVKITFREPQQLRLLVRTKCKELFLSVEEPHAFIAALKKHVPVQAKAA